MKSRRTMKPKTTSSRLHDSFTFGITRIIGTKCGLRRFFRIVCIHLLHIVGSATIRFAILNTAHYIIQSDVYKWNDWKRPKLARYIPLFFHSSSKVWIPQTTFTNRLKLKRPVLYFKMKFYEAIWKNSKWVCSRKLLFTNTNRWGSSRENFHLILS